jgi:hypothetical protein
MIRNATSADLAEVSELRKLQYAAAPEFQVKDQSAVAEQRGSVLLVLHGDEILSTMQVEGAADRPFLERLDRSAIGTSFSAFPTFLLSRAATHVSWRRHGLNSLLRLAVLRRAVAEERIQSLTGMAYVGAPRLHLLERLGYSVEVVPQPDASYIQPVTQRILLCLERDRFIQALDRLNTELAPLFQEFEVEDATVISQPKVEPGF